MKGKDPYESQEFEKEESAMKILTELDKEDLTVTELVRRSGVSRTVVWARLKDMKEDGTVTHQARIPGRSLAVYQITDRGRDKIATLGQSVDTVFHIEPVSELLTGYTSRKAVTDFKNLAIDEPALFLDLLQCAMDWTAFARSEIFTRWIGKHGLKKLESLFPQVQGELVRKAQGNVPETKGEAVNFVKQTLAAVKETIAQGK